MPTTRIRTGVYGPRAGFTLVEMMVVLAILAIVLVLAAPGFVEMISNNRMVTKVYSLRATLNNARSEALARRAPVVICPTTDGNACSATNVWETGYMSFVDTDDDNAADPNDPDEEIIQYEALDTPLEITFDNGNQRVRFSPHGTALGFEGTFTFCDERGDEKASAVILNPVGAVRSAKDTDDSDIVEGLGGADVAC